MSSGDDLFYITPSNAEFPSTSFPTPFYRNGVLVLEYDDTVDEESEFSLLMPEFYAGGGVTVTVGYMAASATSNTVSLDGSFWRNSDDDRDVDSKSFSTAINVNSTTASVSGETKYQDIVFANGSEIDSVLKNQNFRFKLKRDADSTSSTDNMVGDMQLVFIRGRET